MAAGLRRGNDPSKKAQTWREWKKAQDIEKAQTARDMRKAQKACDMQKEALLKMYAIPFSPSWWTQCKSKRVCI